MGYPLIPYASSLHYSLAVSFRESAYDLGTKFLGMLACLLLLPIADFACDLGEVNMAFGTKLLFASFLGVTSVLA